jgi:glycosyltransferase involved in cell wall biosynthesis
VISVVVYTLNDEETIGWCLQSLASQDNSVEHEVIIIDDGSIDKTLEIIKKEFPQFQLIANDQTIGWVAAIHQNLPIFRGDTIAFLGAHCRCRENWLKIIDIEMKSGVDVISGMGFHGRNKLLDRFFSFSQPVYWTTEKEAKFIWDDNFAIRPKILRTALPQTEIVLSNGSGTQLLSKTLKIKGIAIYSCPRLKIDHIHITVKRLLGLWWNEMPNNAIEIRRVDPSIPGGRLLHFGPLVALMITTGRLCDAVKTMITTRKPKHISNLTLVLFICLQTGLMPIYFVGLCREILKKSNSG